MPQSEYKAGCRQSRMNPWELHLGGGSALQVLLRRILGTCQSGNAMEGLIAHRVSRVLPADAVPMAPHQTWQLSPELPQTWHFAANDQKRFSQSRRQEQSCHAQEQ